MELKTDPVKAYSLANKTKQTEKYESDCGDGFSNY